MRDDYLKNALEVIDDPNILVNVVSRRVKQLRKGSRALVESLEKLSLEDIALREIVERKITFEIGAREEAPAPVRLRNHGAIGTGQEPKTAPPVSASRKTSPEALAEK